MSVCVAFTSFKEIKELLDGAHEAFKSQHGFKSYISSMHWLHIYQLNQGFTKFLKVWDPPKVSRCQKRDVKQIFYWQPTNIRHHHRNSVPPRHLVFEIHAHLFLNSKSERKIGKGQNCFTHLLQLLPQKVTVKIPNITVKCCLCTASQNSAHHQAAFRICLWEGCEG
jgi:hypothetical protein